MNSDQPKILKEEDKFQRYEFSKRIAEIVKNNVSERSLVIGLYGKWGEGKTSVMNFIKTELHQDTIIINFNPWLFSDQKHLINSFFTSIACEFNRSLSNKKENFGKILSDYGDAVGLIKYAGFSLSGLAKIGANLKEVSIEKLKARVDKIIADSGKRIIICIDDIDRLDVEEVQYVFKLVKLVADFPKTTYLLAFDDEKVALALAPKYGNTDIANGYHFLEKIIQLPLKIPKASKKALRQYTLDLINKVFHDYKLKIIDQEMAEYMSNFEDYFVPQIDNPRLGIRYANTLAFALPLLVGEVHTSDLMLIEGLKIFFPEAYDYLRLNSTLFLTDTGRDRSSMFNKEELTKEIVKERLNSFLKTYTHNKQTQLLGLFKNIFPCILYAYTNQVGTEDAWREIYKAKRIASGKYFERYFTYGVQEGEISDVYFNQLLGELENSTIQDLTSKFEELFNSISAQDIIFKLRLWEGQLNPIQSKSLSLTLVKMNEKLPHEPGNFDLFTTNAEGAKMISKLILNVPYLERVDFALTIFSSSVDFSFSLRINYWLFYGEEKLEKKNFTSSDVLKIHIYFIDRFKIELKKHNFFEILSDLNLWRLLIWWSEIDKNEVEKLIVNVLNEGVTSAIKLIRMFSPTVNSYGNDGEKAFKSGFTEEQYNSMAKIFAPDLVYEILNKEKFNPLINSGIKKEAGYDSFTDEELASLFLTIHRSKLE